MVKQVFGPTRHSFDEIETQAPLVHPLGKQCHERRITANPLELFFHDDIVVALQVCRALMERAKVIAPTRFVDTPKRRFLHAFGDRVSRGELRLPRVLCKPMLMIVPPEARELGLLAFDGTVELEARSSGSTRVNMQHVHLPDFV